MRQKSHIDGDIDELQLAGFCQGLADPGQLLLTREEMMSIAHD